MVFSFRLKAAAAVFFCIGAGAGALDWYRSNPAGMALERIGSRTVALHAGWALSVEAGDFRSLPAVLRPYYKNTDSLEQRLLYERGKLKRRQWIFREGGRTRVNASLPANLASIGKTGEDGEIPPFVEIFEDDRSLGEIRQYLASGIYATRYSYRDGLLIRSDTFLDNKALWTDSYKYTRSALLRGVERDYHDQASASADIRSRTLPQASLDLRPPPPVPGFVRPVMPYDSSIMSEVLGEIYDVPAAKSLFDTDSQGKILSETRLDEEGNTLAEIKNEWVGDRIKVIRWSRGSDEGRIVFTYSSGDRIAEEDYRNGVLERRVSRNVDTETEEIYMNGKPILRAIWKDGRKISEERLR